jgi:23S rRNA (cytosine1962-C5)-methyltransferase
MFVAENWKDYTLLDAADGERLEKWGDHFSSVPTPRSFGEAKKSATNGKRPGAFTAAVTRAAANG